MGRSSKYVWGIQMEEEWLEVKTGGEDGNLRAAGFFIYTTA